MCTPWVTAPQCGDAPACLSSHRQPVWPAARSAATVWATGGHQSAPGAFAPMLLTGPSLSPLGQVVTGVITPRLGMAERPVAGPPKRFAQGIGVAFSLSAVVLTALGHWGAAQAVLGLLAVAAFLESALGLCLGCRVFALLMRVGMVPQEVCERCNSTRATKP